MMYTASDGRINSEVGQRWAAGGIIESAITQFNIAPMKMFLGASLGTVDQVGTAIHDAFAVSNFWDKPVETLGSAGLAAMVAATASMSMAKKVSIAFQTNKILDKQLGGRARITDEETIYMMFTGAQPSELTQLYRQINLLSNSKEDIDDQVDSLLFLINKHWLADGDLEEQNNIQEAISALSASVSNPDVAEIALSKLRAEVLSEGISQSIFDQNITDVRAGKTRDNNERQK
jgi:hypothetical protein